MGQSAREAQIKAFLATQGWEDARRKVVAADASFRRYERVERGGDVCILMDAPPEHERIAPFVHVAEYLSGLGLSAPAIIARDEEQGFLLLEDLGNDSFTKVLSANSDLSNAYNEGALYKAAIDVLLELHRSDIVQNVPAYDEVLFLKECGLLAEWFLPHLALDADIAALSKEYEDIWRELLPQCYVGDDVVVMRDYHADNLMWLPQRKAEKAVGLLDFQDAVVGPPAYDIVSLLEDARRDVAPATQDEMVDYYLKNRPDLDGEAFRASYALLGAQRNLKIVGIFARLAMRDHKPRYLAYLPRVWAHIERDVNHPLLAPLKAWLDRALPKEKRHPAQLQIKGAIRA